MGGAALALAALLAWGIATRPKSPGSSCKPGDCESCPFPPCNEQEREKNTGGNIPPDWRNL